ncbi:MAG TPA: hypothetical protein VMO78_04360 [Rhizomicrobium sp.]|nr:hypothetical protein [Rhizomicrobium sp.]
MAATALIFSAATMVAPDRIAQIHSARIGYHAGNAAGNCTDCGSGGGVADSRTYCGTTRRANHGATGETITGISTAPGEEQSGRKSSESEGGAHDILLLIGHVTRLRGRCSWFQVPVELEHPNGIPVISAR